MIAKALKLIIEHLKAYIKSIELTDPLPGSPDGSEPPSAFVTLGNIALIESTLTNAGTIKDRIVLSLVNINEEETFKNAPHYERNGTNTRYRNAPIHLNLFLLFSANYDRYENALIRLSQVIEFFQGKRVFTLRDAPPSTADEADVDEFKLILDLYTLTFEQINHLWGSLGGKQVPFVLYKLRLVKVQADRTLASGTAIQEVASREAIR